MASLNAWIKAARLRTLPLALSCTLMGSAFALQNGKFDWVIMVLAMITTTLLQVLSNYANDYGDFQNGADNIKRRADRMLSSGQITENEMKMALAVIASVTFLSGFGLLYVSFSFAQILKFTLMLGIGLVAIWAAMKYTFGKNPYGYRGLGDFFVFVFFGLVGVIGTYYLHTKIIDFDAILGALLVGALSVCVLNLNNMRDIETDKMAGKMTIPVHLGLEKAKIYHFTLLILCWIVMSRLIFREFYWVNVVLFLPILIQVKHFVFVFNCKESAFLDSELKKIAMSTFLFSLLYFFISLYAVFQVEVI
jgi:1,4-dihydroxy-2-naphthoate polyprenyltransferase